MDHGCKLSMSVDIAETVLTNIKKNDIAKQENKKKNKHPLFFPTNKNVGCFLVYKTSLGFHPRLSISFCPEA